MATRYKQLQESITAFKTKVVSGANSGLATKKYIILPPGTPVAHPAPANEFVDNNNQRFNYGDIFHDRNPEFSGNE